MGCMWISRVLMVGDWDPGLGLGISIYLRGREASLSCVLNKIL